MLDSSEAARHPFAGGRRRARRTPGRLDGLRAVVTGASSGIGRAIAEAYAAEGAAVLLTHRASPERAQAVADAIAARGGRAHVRQADLATREGCERLVAEARERLGGSTSGSTTPAPTC